MDVNAPLPLLGGLSPAAFMRRHWQRRPLLVRGAMPEIEAPLARGELFALAGREGVESRVVERDASRWTVRHGPFARRALPPLRRPGWTLLVQGVDLHVPAGHELLTRFRFVPAARLDDLMVSWASDGGGVGPHVDSYDVFLLQLSGVRRWRWGRVADASFVDGLPLKILRRFEPERNERLEPGDLLYLPPGWGHDGVAEGECLTGSIGFRAPRAGELARELLLRLADEADDLRLYADRGQAAAVEPGRVPGGLSRFAERAAAQLLSDPHALARALGEVLSEPKPQVWFDGGERLAPRRGVRLDARSRMLYDEGHLFLNGESYRVAGRDAALLRRLADEGRLDAAAVARLSAAARDGLDQWCRQGWIRRSDA